MGEVYGFQNTFSMYKLEKSDAALIIVFFRKTFIGNLTDKSSTRITSSCLKMKFHFRAVSTMCIAHMRIGPPQSHR